MNKIVEYMAFGKPIVQFDVVEGRFSAGEASLYAKANDPIDMADKIEALLASPEDRARMGAVGARRVAEELSWTLQAAKLIQAYQHLFDGRRSPSVSAKSNKIE
jgi:glycosyltransferase involved in cell wall biosynthesis